MAAQIVERVGVFRLHHDGKAERQTVDDPEALLRRGDRCFGIIHAEAFAKRVEFVLRVKGLQQRLGDKAVCDEALKMVVVAAEQPCVVVRAGNDEQLLVILGAFAQHAQQRAGKHILSLKAIENAAGEKLGVPRGDKLRGTQQQRRDLRIRLAEQPRRAVGVFIAAEYDGQKILFHRVCACLSSYSARYFRVSSTSLG